MSFGGSVLAMITSLKNNSRKKNIKSYFEQSGSVFLHSNPHSKLDKLLKKKASPEQLEKIKTKIRKERRKTNTVLNKFQATKIQHIY